MYTPGRFSAECRFERPAPDCAVIILTGELDACSAPRIEEEIAAQLSAASPRVVLDLTDVEFIDSAGIRLVMLVANRATPSNEVVVINPHARLARRALDIVGIARIVPTADALAELFPEGVASA
ncbi:MAG TPA: STAS domain-containing protein [Armatimonadota bacterium]|nr:STAS domain-containing protein [Armatimonadota bacterium]